MRELKRFLRGSNPVDKKGFLRYVLSILSSFVSKLLDIVEARQTFV